jgi:hypothetical protein
MTYADTVLTIERLAQRVAEDESRIGVLSTGEFIAVALVLERYDLLKEAKYTMLEAVNRLGEEWLAAAIEVQRSSWRDDNGKLRFGPA